MKKESLASILPKKRKSKGRPEKAMEKVPKRKKESISSQKTKIKENPRTDGLEHLLQSIFNTN